MRFFTVSRIRSILAGFFAISFVLALPVKATNITVSAVVVNETPVVKQNPTVELRGIIAPNVSYVITHNGVEIARGTTGADGSFIITLPDQLTGQQTFVITATDSEGRAFASFTFTFNLQSGTTTIVTGIFLGPTISINKAAVKLGESVTISGTSVPGSIVTLSVNSVRAMTESITAASDGSWSKSINTSDLGVGTHVVKARAVSSDSIMSAYSDEVTFAVNPLEKCDGKKTADLNCDESVNLTDFSILLYFWKKTNPTNTRADINKDGVVSIVDFSIMLYQWTD